VLRAVLAVIAGYVTLFAIVFASLSIAYLALGPERAFRPRTYDVSTTWLITHFILGLVGTMAGGAVCAWIARGRGAPMVLAVFVLVLGLLGAVAIALTPAPESPLLRDATVGNLEAMQMARQPLWVALVNALVGPAGVLIGARAVRRPTRP
jgi:hypothetical protein